MKHETPSPFGELLRAYRKRSHLTQRQLATTLGIHYNTISGWERGDTLPEKKKIILVLSKCLNLDDMESRQLLEASLTAPAPYWNVPLRRNPFFTGREQVLEVLHERLGVDRVVALTQSYAIHGLGGIGKTQLAIEYAYQHALEYSAIFWISAESVEQILISFFSIAELLRLPERLEADQQRVVAAVQDWLSRYSKWLLVWDNLEDLQLLRRYFPLTRQGAVLITTRQQGLGTLTQDLELLVMGQEEGMLLLLRRAKILEGEIDMEHMEQLATSQPGEYAALREVVTILGGLPLALDQAGAYIEASRCSIGDYLFLLQSSQLRVLDEHTTSMDYPLSVIKTFTLVFEQLEQSNPLAVEVLTACAFLAPEAIPEAFFLEGATYLGAPFDGLDDPFMLQATLKALLTFSLIQRDASMHTLSIHRLVQVALKGRLSPTARQSWAGRVIRVIARLFPSNENMRAGYWPLCEQLLSHALVCLSVDEFENEEDALVLMTHVATYLSRRVRYAEAEPLFVRAIQRGEHTPGLPHSLIAEALVGLGILYQEQGKYEQAEALLTQTLRTWEQSLGPDHAQIAHLLNNLGNLYSLQGKYEQAEPLLERALSIWERALGSDHPQLATALNNLGILYNERGKYEQAEPLFVHALHIREQTLGPDDPSVAYPLQNLGELYLAQGKYEQAEPLLKRALSIWKRSLGPDHPLTAYTLDSLGELYLAQGKYEQAEPLLERALHIIEQAWSPDHPSVTYPLQKLGELYTMQARYERAEPLLERALRIRVQTLGSDHPLVARSLNGLANLAWKQRQYQRAETLYQRALAQRQKQRGPSHPEVAETLQDMAIFRQQQGNLSESVSLAARALSIYAQSLGEIHPKMVAARAFYAQLVMEQQNAKEKARVQHVPDEAAELHGEGQPEERTKVEKPQEAADPVPTNTPLRGFLDVCCDLHPRAWSRASDLWEAYKSWVEQYHERYPLSRGAFIAQLKALGCRADRTKTARIWRGIALVNSER